MVQITGLNIYPVKSCRGIALSQARLTETGFEHDREWLVITPEGRFLTQRERPQLAQIETALSDGQLVLRKPNGADLSLPLNLTGPELEVTIWRDKAAAFDAGDAAATWLTEHLGKPARLVRFDKRHKRASNMQWTGGVEALTQFADGYPWLLISQGSLEELNRRMTTPLPMNRFRPNIVVDGLPPFGEDSVDEFVAGDVRLKVVKPCDRCVITTTDQITGERNSDEPLKALKEFRFDRNLRGVLFGQNMILTGGVGKELKVGQQFEVTAGTSKASIG
ncbi:Fe-S protein [Steroidobacter agaridevorans]|uniref:Fe-S protein n=1 Tax=Steroidobacter agaridevorans TaxID=2695856 RepID=A0A829YMG9_9GAMM|nr:MOSC N-terminal beta barrel domain-containing protein [Steroidobacter agaridevorans]GFE84440.1 Fe-S protein [Steroidobacter agaridevorans]GFE90838.1 Fe-S protein [Steroidobacter agaridevorans]